MSRAIDSENLYKFLTDQCVKGAGAFAKGVNKGLNIARATLRNEQITPTITPQNEWVSVEERLPENDAPVGRKQITVLVCSKAKKVSVASRIYEPEREYSGKVYPARWRWSKLMNNYVTHWMPLPVPPDHRPPEGET